MRELQLERRRIQPPDLNTGSAYFLDGAWEGPIGGTSWSSPIFSALLTEVDQRHNSRLGYVNPLIYQKSGAVLQPYGVSGRWLVVKRRIAPQGDLSLRASELV